MNDYSYSIEDCLYINHLCGVPIVFDGHHWEVGAKSQSYTDDMLKAYETWGDVIPTFHWSNSRRDWEDPKAKPTAHSDWYYEPFNDCGISVDVVLECKKKELALLKYRKDFVEDTALAA